MKPSTKFHVDCIPKIIAWRRIINILNKLNKGNNLIETMNSWKLPKSSKCPKLNHMKKEKEEINDMKLQRFFPQHTPYQDKEISASNTQRAITSIQNMQWSFKSLKMYRIFLTLDHSQLNEQRRHIDIDTYMHADINLYMKACANT